jgi:glycosyltransferase involved in cell wall biosynthesis
MPSLEEAFGVAILEALAAGLIVVSSSVGGIPEIISNNKNGYLIEPDNPQELAKRLVHITNNPEEAQKIIEEGYKTVEQFTVEKMVEQTYKIYSDVLKRK